MTIEYRKLVDIKPYPKNARKIPQSAIDAVALSIKSFGFQQPIVVDRDGVIIVGHCRLLAARKLGLTEAPVHVAEHLTPAQVRQYRLMDNRSHEEAKWDMDILTAEMLELKALDLDLSLTGFSSGELDRMTRNPLDGEDDAPPVPECPVNLKPGEIAYEPFAGSGPQFIAAEVTERRCFGIELDPAHCDVIVTRWQNLTGKEATVGDGPHKGCTFAHAKHGRQLEGQGAILEEVLNGAS